MGSWLDSTIDVLRLLPGTGLRPAVPPWLPAPTGTGHSTSPAITGWTRPALLSGSLRRSSGGSEVIASSTPFRTTLPGTARRDAQVWRW